MKEYAFDVKLAAVVRVKAPNAALARATMERVLECCQPSQGFLDGYNEASDLVEITEFSLAEDDAGGSVLFEVDGQPMINL